MDIDGKKSYIISNIDKLDYKEKKDILTMLLTKYNHIIKDKPTIGSAIELNDVDDETITNVYNYTHNVMEKKLNQFKN